MADPLTQKPLWHYVIAVLVVWALILGGMWIWNRPRLRDFALVCGGFFIGMLAMYIAVPCLQKDVGAARSWYLRTRRAYPSG
jgi:hypothetical protein